MNHLGDTNKMVGEDHIRDATKMVSDTPMTDKAYFKNSATMYDLAGEMKRVERELNAANEKIEVLLVSDCERLRIEEELNAANDRIKQLEEMYEGVIGEKPELLGSNVMGLLKRELNFAQNRIKRLEEALDTLTLVVGLTPIVGNKDALQEAMDMARAELKAKEAKP